jgi:acetyltransferase
MLIGIAQDKGLKSLYGVVLRDNAKMVGLVKSLGFTLVPADVDEFKASLDL